MVKMKNILLIAILIVASSKLFAQTQNIYDKLSTADLASRNAVEVNEQSSIKNIATPQNQTVNSIRGYRIRIFFDNSQSARSSAQQVQEQFKGLYPSIPCNLIYENPYFKVTVGNCLSMEEAIMLWNKVSKSFEKAFIIREDIPFEALETYVPMDPITPVSDSLELQVIEPLDS